MVPDLFFALETMPLTNTGKIDREALPEPAAEHLVARLDYQAPGNWIEEQVAVPAEATQRRIILQFHFHSDNFQPEDILLDGWYLDDISIIPE